MPDPNESGIATRLFRRRKEIPQFQIPSEVSQSSEEQFSDSENEEKSDSPVYRRSRSVLPDLTPSLVPRKDTSPPRSAPPTMPHPTPWLSSERVQEFLRKYADNMEKQKRQENDSDCLSMSVRDPGDPKSPEQKNSGVNRKSVVRFREELEGCSSPVSKQQPPRRSWYPTPIGLIPPGAMSTPFPVVAGIKKYKRMQTTMRLHLKEN